MDDLVYIVYKNTNLLRLFFLIPINSKFILQDIQLFAS